MVPTDPLRLWVPDSATEGTTQRANMQNALMGTQSCSDHSFENESIHQDFIMTLIHDLQKVMNSPKHVYSFNKYLLLPNRVTSNNYTLSTM